MLVNNGKFINAGCRSKEHARITTKIILERIQNMEHEVEYYVSDNFNGKHLKKIFMRDILKKYGSLYRLLIKRFDRKQIYHYLNQVCQKTKDFLYLKKL